MLLAPPRSVYPELRCKFYFREQRLSFHTAWVISGSARCVDGLPRAWPVYLGKPSPGEGAAGTGTRRGLRFEAYVPSGLANNGAASMESDHSAGASAAAPGTDGLKFDSPHSRRCRRSSSRYTTGVV